MTEYDLRTESGLAHYLLPNIHFEAQVFEEMFRSAEERLKLLTNAYAENRDARYPDQRVEEAIVDEGAEINAMRIDIAEIALTAIFHWVERRCNGLASMKDSSFKSSNLRPHFQDSVMALKKCGVYAKSIEQYELIDSVLRPFANSWKHNDGPNPQLLAVLGIAQEVPNLLDDHEVTKALARKINLDAASLSVIVSRYAREALNFLDSMYRLAYPQT